MSHHICTILEICIQYKCYFTYMKVCYTYTNLYSAYTILIQIDILWIHYTNTNLYITYTNYTNLSMHITMTLISMACLLSYSISYHVYIHHGKRNTTMIWKWNKMNHTTNTMSCIWNALLCTNFLCASIPVLYFSVLSL